MSFPSASSSPVGDEPTFEQYRGLANGLARRFAHRGEPLEDLQQVASLALFKALRRYDPEKGTSFTTYATACVLGELKRYLRDHCWVLRVPRRQQELYLAVKKVREELGHELGRSPTVSEVAASLGVTEESVLESLEAGASYWPLSLDMPVAGSEDAETYADGLPDVDDGFDKVLDRQRLVELIPSLNSREQRTLRRYFFEQRTQKAIAAELGISQMQVSRTLASALARLRAAWEPEEAAGWR